MKNRIAKLSVAVVFLLSAFPALGQKRLVITVGTGRDFSKDPLVGQLIHPEIRLYERDLSRCDSIANESMGFSNLGLHPGISSDGQIIVFYGELSAAGRVALNLNQQNITDISGDKFRG